MKGKELINVKGKDCPIAQASMLVGDMWVILIIRDLLTGERRFTELEHSLVSSANHSINSRTLTDRLKMLEEMKVVTRKVYAHTLPPKVEYSLTEKGKALSSVIEKIRHYGQKYF